MKKLFAFIILIIIICLICEKPVTKLIDFFIPPNIATIAGDDVQKLYTTNVTKAFFETYLHARLKEFRFPLYKDLIIRVYSRLFNRSRPVIAVQQAFYSHIYYKNGPNYATVPFLTLKNVGDRPAKIISIDINIDSETKHNYQKPDFQNYFPLVLFPNEEVVLFYGQEIPPTKFASTVKEIKYENIVGSKDFSCKLHKKEFLYNFNKRIYQFFW